MQIVADLASYRLVKTEATPSAGTVQNTNGQFIFPVPEGAAVEVNSSSYLLPQDAGSLSNQAAQALLARYPQYTFVESNFFLEAADIAKLDLVSGGPVGSYPRVQVGRGVGPLAGAAPNSVRLLPANNATGGPIAPGMVTTVTLPLTPPGIDECLIWWRVAGGATSHDVINGYGASAGQDIPARRDRIEILQDPAALQVYASNDGGANWVPASRLTPVSFTGLGTNLKLAFLNTSSSAGNRLYLLAYAVLW
jgi:hypothetical protein